MAEELIRFRFPGVPGVQCAFTTRRGGVSQGPFASANLSFDVGDAAGHVLANRSRLLEALCPGSWQELRQVHGTEMVFDPRPGNAREQAELQGDGLATALPGRALVIKTADCQPILLAHNSGSHIAALHCGWRGNRAGFPGLGVDLFCSRYGLDPGDLVAVRGPSLSPAQAEFVNYEQEWGRGFEAYYDSRRRTMDLWRMTADQLAAAGLPRSSVFSFDLCTYELEELFFSYRRAKVCGRQLGIIWRDEGQGEE